MKVLHASTDDRGKTSIYVRDGIDVKRIELSSLHITFSQPKDAASIVGFGTYSNVLMQTISPGTPRERRTYGQPILDLVALPPKKG